MIACLCEDSHGGPQCQLNMSRLQVAVREIGREFQVSDSIFRFLRSQSLPFRLEPQTNNVLLGQGNNVLNLEFAKGFCVSDCAALDDRATYTSTASASV